VQKSHYGSSTFLDSECVALKLVAIDFETANYSPDSACALGIAVIENGRITHKEYSLIRPPKNNFVFSYLHGICWSQVRSQPSFIEVWDSFASLLHDADFLLAHYAPFDRRVLSACCSRANREPVLLPFICTVRVARSVWKFRPASLDNVCSQLGISLRHHHAGSDALACATIAVRAMELGFSLRSAIVGQIHETGSKRRVSGKQALPI
jgi:DNA polymerase-3 subunit epsilon